MMAKARNLQEPKKPLMQALQNYSHHRMITRNKNGYKQMIDDTEDDDPAESLSVVDPHKRGPA